MKALSETVRMFAGTDLTSERFYRHSSFILIELLLFIVFIRGGSGETVWKETV